FSFYDSAYSDLYILSLHDALPILLLASLLVFDWLALLLQPTAKSIVIRVIPDTKIFFFIVLTSDIVINIILQNHTLNPYESYFRSEEHTSELQSRFDIVCRLLLEK